MKSLDSDQSPLVASSGIAVLPLVKLITYTDKGAGTVDATYYISKRSLKDYDYGDPVTPDPQWFHPWLVGVTTFASSTIHMPGTGGSGIVIKSFNVILHNSPYQGSRVAALLAAHTLEGARVEFAQLLVGEKTASPIDMSGYTGDEHTMEVRGVVKRVLVNNETLTLECENELPDFDWPQVLDASTANPRDVGVRLPVPYGDTWIPCPSWDVGWRTNTSVPILSDVSTGSLSVVDGSGFPQSGDFLVKIGSEILRLTHSSGDVFTINERAMLSTIGAPHPAGMPLSELVTETTHVVSLFPMSSLKGILARNPFDGQLLEVVTGFSYYSRDQRLISGREIANVRFSQQQLIDLLEYFEAQQSVDAPPEPPAPDTQRPSSSTMSANAWDGDEDTYARVQRSAGGSQQQFYANFNSLSANTESVTVRLKTGDREGIVWLEIKRVSNGQVMRHTESGSGWLEFEAGPADEDWLIDIRLETGGGDKYIDLYEFERIVYEGVPETVEVPVEIQAATLAADLELYASVDGIESPVAYGAGYDFEDSDTWNTYQCTQARDTTVYIEGAVSRKQNVDVLTGGTVVIDCDALTNWVSGGLGAGYPQIVTTPTQTEGTGCLAAEEGSGTSYIQFNSGFGIDLTDTGSGAGLVVFDLQINGGGVTTGIKVWLGSTDFFGGDRDGYLWQLALKPSIGGDFSVPTKDVWYTIVLDYREHQDVMLQAGNFDPSDWNSFDIHDFSSGMTIFVDNVRVVRVGDLEAVIQNNSLGGVDLSADGPIYRMQVRPSGDLDPTTLNYRVELSQTTGTGTTQQAVRRTISFAAREGVIDQWAPNRSEGVDDTGSPDMTDINTMRIVTDFPLPAPGAFLVTDPTTGSLNFDDLRLGDDDLNPYEAEVGQRIEHPADVARHWINEVGGQTVDETTWAASVTNLGTNKLAGDARGWGVNWREVLDHIGYISRSNFTQEEIAANTEWRMLQALAGYGWGSSARTLDMFKPGDITQGGRDDQPNRDLASARTFLYDYRPWIGIDDSAFVGLIRIGSDQNDASAKVAAGVITAAVAAIGEKPAPLAFLKGIADEDTAIEIAGYYYTEGARVAAVIIAIRDLSWSQGYDLEVGDIVAMTRPWVSGALTLRLIEIEKDFRTQRVNVQGVSV